MTDRTEVAIIAAMEREIAPLIRGWEMILGPRYRFFEHGNVIAFAGGIGPEAARAAADTVLTFRQPSLIISAGFAGALRESMPVGTVVVPTKVLAAGNEQTFRIEGGEGTLVSVDSIVDPAEKRNLATKYAADVVDMEAAAVAEVARNRGVRFAAVKAVSDSARFELPPLSRFIDADGEFQTMRFVAHVAFRPPLWPALGRLKRNAEKAAKALCAYLTRIQRAADVDQLFVGDRVTH
jgi:adenosylhomocysteine nucleosidase